MEDLISPKVKNIWIIDDDSVFAILSKRVIEITGMAEHVEIIKHAESALFKFHSLLTDEDNLPEIIFLDIHMPGMNGFEFLSHLDKLPHSIPAKVFIFSAAITPEDRKKTLSFKRVQGIIEKPLTTDKLKKIAAAL